LTDKLAAFVRANHNVTPHHVALLEMLQQYQEKVQLANDQKAAEALQEEQRQERMSHFEQRLGMVPPGAVPPRLSNTQLSRQQEMENNVMFGLPSANALASGLNGLAQPTPNTASTITSGGMALTPILTLPSPAVTSPIPASQPQKKRKAIGTSQKKPSSRPPPGYVDHVLNGEGGEGGDPILTMGANLTTAMTNLAGVFAAQQHSNTMATAGSTSRHSSNMTPSNPEQKKLEGKIKAQREKYHEWAICKKQALEAQDQAGVESCTRYMAKALQKIEKYQSALDDLESP